MTSVTLETVGRLPRLAAQGMVRLYQMLLSPFLGNQCRFHPSCSNYALEALDRYGAVKGGWLALRRLSRCHPYHPGGFDPVPGVPADSTEAEPKEY